MTPAGHPIEWTDEKVARFWDHLSRAAGQDESYFARMVGRGVVEFSRRMLRLEGRILDLGCGPGHLIEQLLARGIACEGADFSPDSVARCEARFHHHPLWRGAQQLRSGALPYPDACMDAVFCLETVEHVLPHHLDTLFREIARILKPATGRLIITTPNAENLPGNQVCCPECGSIFHRYQHVHSWTRDSLARFLESSGFQTVACNTTDFARFQQPLWPGLLDVTPRRVARIAWSMAMRIMDAAGLRGRQPGGRWVNQFVGKGPNLFWIGGRA